MSLYLRYSLVARGSRHAMRLNEMVDHADGHVLQLSLP